MDKLLIRGGRALHGAIDIAGAKNAALPELCAALLSAQPVELHNVPQLQDVATMVALLRNMGVRVETVAPGSLRIDAATLTSPEAPYELVKTMRASVLALGPLLARFGEATVSLPGGCAIGSRPVDLHLKGLRALGATVNIEHGFVEAVAEKLYGANIYLDYPSVGATENIMMAATLADGQTVMENCAQEPEIVDLADMLNAMGADVRGAGTERIVINGVAKLHGCDHEVIPDRIEAGTYMMAAAITRGELTLQKIRLDHMQAVVSKLTEMGVLIHAVDANTCIVKAPEDLKPVDIRTLPYPGFPTDLQAPVMALLATIDGTSMISETVFENRFLHVDELLRMGANIKTEGNAAVIQGTRRLTGAPVRATDLRAGAALIIAGMAAEGETSIGGLHHIDRGYENLEAKLNAAGGTLKRSQVADPLLV